MLTFFVRHRSDLTEFAECRLEERGEGHKRALGLGWRAFAKLIGGLPQWEGDSTSKPGSPPRPA